MHIDGDDVSNFADGVQDVGNKIAEDPRTPVKVKMSLPIILALIPLVGIMLGILANTAVERRARADEKASRERQEQIRRVEIGIEIYKEVAVAQAHVDSSIERCESTQEEYWEIYDVSWSDVLGDKQDITEEDFAAIDAIPDVSAAKRSWDQACATAAEGFTDVEVALDQAILVSPDSLVDAVRTYRADWLRWEDAWKASIDGENLDQCFGGSEQELSDDEFAKCVEEAGEQAPRLKRDLDASGERLSEVIRQIVLLQYAPEVAASTTLP